MRILDIITFILLAIGGINWGLVGAFDFDLVDFLFANYPAIENIIYILVGLSAIYQIFRHCSCCHTADHDACCTPTTDAPGTTTKGDNSSKF